MELHAGDMALPAHREACLSILAQIYVRGAREICTDQDVSFTFQTNADDLGIRNIKKSKVLFYTSHVLYQIQRKLFA